MIAKRDVAAEMFGMRNVLVELGKQAEEESDEDTDGYMAAIGDAIDHLNKIVARLGIELGAGGEGVSENYRTDKTTSGSPPRARRPRNSYR
jgi:hypothetical protein